MTEQPLTLRDIALKASDRFGGVRGRALGREAERAGVKIVYTTIDKIIAGTYTSRPTEATLRALATLAQVPIETVYAAADRPIPQAPFAELLPDGVDALSPGQREAALAVIRQFVLANDGLVMGGVTVGSFSHWTPISPVVEVDAVVPIDVDLDDLSPAEVLAQVHDFGTPSGIAGGVALDLIQRAGGIDGAVKEAQQQHMRMDTSFSALVLEILREWRAGSQDSVEVIAARTDETGQLSRGQAHRRQLDSVGEESQDSEVS